MLDFDHHGIAFISTHTPLARRDFISVNPKHFVKFLLTRLLRGVTVLPFPRAVVWTFLLTRLLRGVTKTADGNAFVKTISTHTPLARRDDRIHRATQF